jgi:hypothetical protein
MLGSIRDNDNREGGDWGVRDLPGVVASSMKGRVSI